MATLPEAVEHPSHGGEPAFRVRTKNFVYCRDDDQTLAVYVASEEAKLELVAVKPDIYFTTAHYDGWPVVLVRLVVIGRSELAELLTEAWRLRAPTRLRKSFDQATGTAQGTDPARPRGRASGRLGNSRAGAMGPGRLIANRAAVDARSPSRWRRPGMWRPATSLPVERFPGETVVTTAAEDGCIERVPDNLDKRIVDDLSLFYLSAESRLRPGRSRRALHRHIDPTHDPTHRSLTVGLLGHRQRIAGGDRHPQPRPLRQRRGACRPGQPVESLVAAPTPPGVARRPAPCPARAVIEPAIERAHNGFRWSG